MPRNAVDLIHAFNAGRDPERLALKYRAMAADPFAFLRGSCHLFYQDYAVSGIGLATPSVWISGDLHLENFGSYLSDRRQAYFDLNDFGESVLAPADWELSRFLVSVWVATETLALKASERLLLCQKFLATYGATLSAGKAHPVDKAAARGMVRDLLRNIVKRDKAEYLDARTQIQHGQRRLRVDGKKALAIPQPDRDKVAQLISTHAASQADPDFFRLLDVARRIAGTGSLGIERYVLLVRGDGDKEAPSLLDLRLEPGSALAPLASLQQPRWSSEAARVVAIQRQMQADTPAFLTALSLGRQSYVLRELLPNQDRLDFKDWNGKLGRLENVMHSMGAILASAQLRSAAWQGSASLAALQAFAANLPTMQAALLDHARDYSKRLIGDWQDFAKSHAIDPHP